jgi:flagellar P-ring protein FlgI
VKIFLVIASALLISLSSIAHANGVRLKDIARIQDEKDLSLIGYGLVIGLSGTGDSTRNKMTIQSLKNTLSNFGLMLDEKDIISRNVAAVMVTAKISSFAEQGDQFDIAVSSIGDAKSLSGGTLMLMPLYGVDQKIYSFAQGQLSVGGYEFEQDNNAYRKNHTTVGKVVKGATMERSIASLTGLSREIHIVLNEPDYTTATKVVSAIKAQGFSAGISAVHPGKLALEVPNGMNKVEFISKLESVLVQPDASGKVVINERTGTIVAGSNVVLGAVSIAHGNLKIEIKTRYTASQPTNGFFSGSGVQSVVIPEVDLKVEEENGRPLSLPEGTTVSDLVVALNKINLSTRDIITILQSVKTAGALHADLIIE